MCFAVTLLRKSGISDWQQYLINLYRMYNQEDILKALYFANTVCLCHINQQMIDKETTIKNDKF